MIASDGIHSVVRSHYYPDEGMPLWNGTIMWRGTTVGKPFLTGANSARPHETLYWRYGPQWAVRHGDLKLVVSKGGSGKPELYDLWLDCLRRAVKEFDPLFGDETDAAWRRVMRLRCSAACRTACKPVVSHSTTPGG